MIFVFGSNLDGIHGAGAARFALQWYGQFMGRVKDIGATATLSRQKATALPI